MTFWLIAAGLAAFVLVVLLAAGLRGGTPSTRARDHDLAVYRDQLAEVERDRERGVVGAEEAAAAEAEIKRRMMSAAHADTTASDTAAARRWPFVAAALVPCLGIALYMALGRPELADGEVKIVRGPSAEDMRRAARMSPQARAQMIRGMVEGLAARLKQNPDDFAGWMRLGRAWTVLREFTKAADAYRQAMGLRPKDAGALSGFVATRLRSLKPGAPLTADIRDAVGRLALVQPGHPLALYFGGVIAAEAKNYDVALKLWRALLARLPANSPLAPVLKRRIAAAEKARGQGQEEAPKK